MKLEDWVFDLIPNNPHEIHMAELALSYERHHKKVIPLFKLFGIITNLENAGRIRTRLWKEGNRVRRFITRAPAEN